MTGAVTAHSGTLAVPGNVVERQRGLAKGAFCGDAADDPLALAASGTAVDVILMVQQAQPRDLPAW